MEFKRLNRELIHKGRIIELYKDTMQIPNGNIVEWDFVKHKGAAAVIPVTKDGHILMVRQYRGPLERYTLEIPAGGLNGEEEPMIDCAYRELEEETGFRTEKLEHLITINTTVAFCNEKIGIFVAKELLSSRQNLDEDEFLNVERYTIEELTDMIFGGEITDAKTVAALLAYQSKYC